MTSLPPPPDDLSEVTGDAAPAAGETQDEVAEGVSAGQQLSEAQAPLVTLTRLEPVAVRSVWPTEPHHFTPWLLANADLLGEVLGMDIELDAREYKVGKFSLDLIGRDLATGDPVIVENQYGPTDHVHLGQILTYAGGTKPSTVIWVAEDFRDEHRAALEWLNAHTDTDIRFFGIKIAAVTLRGAPAGLIAPSLDLIVAPNDFEKRAVAAASTAASGASTPTAALYGEFWAKFAPIAKERGWSNASASTQNWWLMSAGVAGASWTVSYAQFGCRSELFFNHPDPAVNLARWTMLNQQKQTIEGAFGNGELMFDDLPNNKGCRIETRLLGPKIGETEKWDDVRAWMVDTQQRLREAIKAAGGVPTVVPSSTPTDTAYTI